MHDIRYIREHPAAFDEALQKRGLEPRSTEVLAIDAKRRALIHEAETAKAEQNAASKDIGQAKANGDEAEFERLRSLVSEKKSQLTDVENQAREADEALSNILMALPNIPAPDVPIGEDEDDNVEIRRWGEPNMLDFEPREHFEIPSVQKLFDFERAAKMSGARFAILKGAVARLHRAIGQFMINMHVNEHELYETQTPVLVRDEPLYGTGNLPKFSEDLYRTEEGHWLIPTAEVTLTNMVNGEIVDPATLPMRMVAQTQCFRSEAGSAGRDVTGILRQHQFEKVEMVTICHPETSAEEHERMTNCAENVLKALALPYRMVVLCTGDMGVGAQKTYDIEVWLPGQNKYREISSCSNCGSFQARRMNARFRNQDDKTEFLHTLNGSGLAVGRTLIAVLENGQQADGSVRLPDALAPYLGGKSFISLEGQLI